MSRINAKLMKARKEALDAIARKHRGVLRAEDVVEEARNPKHILHGIFEWQDGIAAHKFRVQQAREYIANVEYVYSVDERTYRAPEWVKDPRREHHEQGYVSLDRLKSDKELARESLVQEFSRAAGHLQRAHDLARALRFKPKEVESIYRRTNVLKDGAERIAFNS